MAHSWGMSGLFRQLRGWACAALLVLAALCAGPRASFAQDPYANSITNPAIATASSDWIVTLGGWGVVSPEFSGSSHYDFGGTPIIDIRHAGSREWLSLPKDGIDYELFETENFRAGPVGTIRWDFGNSEDRGLKEIGNTGIDLSLELGAFVEYWPTDWWRTRLEARNAVYGAEGWVFDLSSDFVWHATPQWTLAAGPRLSIADSDYMNAYYGLNAHEAESLHLSKYEASAGVRSTGAGIYAEYKWNDQLTTMASFEYERLVASAADSPLVRDDGSPDQFTFGVGAKYQFVWK
ncbi:MAG: MipA/OmpV family protein [Hyphomicrobium sp.]|uniref:MipA/OmpV family protein n=1 Tax=Hyphomicrobium sp. TaxID=82 RepID=UPI0039E4CE69